MKQALYCSLLLVGASLLIEAPAVAQSPPPDPVEETLPGRPEPLEPLPELPSAPKDPIQLEEETPPLSPPATEGVPAGSFFVEDIQVIGNTIFQDEIEALVEPLEGRDITLQELLNLRTAISNLYINNGYISSGAFVPTNQDLSDAIIQLQIVEGGVEQMCDLHPGVRHAA